MTFFFFYKNGKCLSLYCASLMSRQIRELYNNVRIFVKQRRARIIVIIIIIDLMMFPLQIISSSYCLSDSLLSSTDFWTFLEYNLFVFSDISLYFSTSELLFHPTYNFSSFFNFFIIFHKNYILFISSHFHS